MKFLLVKHYQGKVSTRTVTIDLPYQPISDKIISTILGMDDFLSVNVLDMEMYYEIERTDDTWTITAPVMMEELKFLTIMNVSVVNGIE